MKFPKQIKIIHFGINNIKYRLTCQYMYYINCARVSFYYTYLYRYYFRYSLHLLLVITHKTLNVLGNISSIKNIRSLNACMQYSNIAIVIFIMWCL